MSAADHGDVADPWLGTGSTAAPSDLQLVDGSRVGVIGGGPAGSLFTVFLLEMAERVGLSLDVTIHEARDFTRPGPAGCNHCGGIISETLVQSLAAEGILLPPTVVQRGIDSYTLHTDRDRVRIETPLQEKRIAAVFRGSGPRGLSEPKWESFDNHLLGLATERGAHLVRKRVEGLDWADDGRTRFRFGKEESEPFDLTVLAVGVNGTALKLLGDLGIEYRLPGTTKTHICEIPMEQESVDEHLGTSMHVFLLNIPRLEFAALIPKGEHVTLCLLGDDIDDALVQRFLACPEVQRCLPDGTGDFKRLCHCSPRLNIRAGLMPFADRVVMIGDCGVTRLYKDGIGAAQRTAKAAAATAVLHGISAEDFRRHMWPVCRAINGDNRLGRMVFRLTGLLQRFGFTRRAIVRMAASEQRRAGSRRRMSLALWDMFTGSAPYREVLLRTLHPLFGLRLMWDMAVCAVPRRRARS
ncbi:hypothetical protein JXA47_05200 [Candidatus Sumerlaeota bacterium]|nr:hypothetical protein [Candidatus Sumerlaeota bacterium]